MLLAPMVTLALVVPHRLATPMAQARVPKATPTMQFGSFKNPFADKDAGATTVSLTVGFSCVDRHSSILAQLDELSLHGPTRPVRVE